MSNPLACDASVPAPPAGECPLLSCATSQPIDRARVLQRWRFKRLAEAFAETPATSRAELTALDAEIDSHPVPTR